MIHAFTRWPDTVELDLWPFAMSYAVYLWNRTPVVGVGLCPEELFSRVKFHTGTLTNAKVWGCPAFVLDQSLKGGVKIPRWSSRSCTGQFLGYSLRHASTIGLIRNLRTQAILPQYHVVYDNLFETAESPADSLPTW